MQALIHQTRIQELQFGIQGSGVTLGQDVRLEYDQQNRVAAFVKLPARWSFGFSKNKRKRLGYLGSEAATLITPALERQASLRVRIVELEPAHARGEGVDQVSVSIWGQPSDLQPLKQEPSAQPQSQSVD